MRRGFLLFLLFVPSCDGAPPPPPREGTVRVSGVDVRVQIEATEAGRRDAIVRRATAPDATPFLLAWPAERYVHAHGESTRRAFVVAFLSRDREVVDVQTLRALDDVGITSAREAAWALFLPSERFGDLEPRGVAEIQPAVEADPMVELGFGDATLRVELALTDGERQRGLMHRPRMSPDEGMLFVYPRTPREPLAFWMKNTLIPLSLAYIREDGTVAQIFPRMEPGDLDSSHYRGREPARYALEVNAGWFESHHVGEGATVRWPEGFDAWIRRAQ